ncbi:hypothetical protein F442_07010 [Phytophthora nicotianae P10297]|uniref:C2H2-type domain-containing protein n=1 Tax=Phytophthora nicotianae P10297 TaxID=1317064 RepID=W2ZHP6_PHYNI|nr:hypothetical protein F442_07010 [Phytophthora nicotianae P10297]
MSSSLQELSKALKVVVGMLHSGWEPGAFSFMRSMPGGAEQESHQDYQESDLVRAREHHPGGVPASMIFALEPGTKLRIYVGCFTARDDSKARVVEIPVGFCVLFRGDLIHNGMPYTTTNYRLHCYLSYAGMKWTPDIVQDALPQHGECQYCGEKVEKGQALRKHRFYCEKNPKGVENRLKRKREYKKGKYKCEVCDKVFKRQTSLRVHKMREHSA